MEFFMKITKVDIYMLDATAQRASRRPICCRVWTDEGFYGDGEAGIAFDYAAPAGIGMLQDISRLVIGKDPMRTDELWERMFKVSFWGQGGGPVDGLGVEALAGNALPGHPLLQRRVVNDDISHRLGVLPAGGKPGQVHHPADVLPGNGGFLKTAAAGTFP